MTGAPPYVGLAPFGEADADRFFGRDAERTRIIANLRASRFTLLYARSGVGKSSLLRAGVVARLAAAPGSRSVPFVFSSWSGDPNVELPRALGADGEDLESALERRTSDTDGPLLVILDQFEEFFEYHHNTAEGKRFADDLARCVQRTDLRAHFLVSIREDAYSRLGDEFKGRLPNVYSNYLHLDDLDERGARAAIEEPLRQADNASIEPPLVDQVLRDVRRDEASNGNARYETAHLQYVLRRLWDEEARRGSPVLRLATLEGLGGSKAIFERHFEEAVAGLGSAEQDVLAKAFRFLVTTAGTKRAESAADLAELADVPLPTLERALEHLREARVLTPVAADGQTRYELAHDLLAAPALEWRRERERARELRALRRIIAGLAVVATFLAALIVWALLERAAAARQADRAGAQAMLAESTEELSADPERSVKLARAAWQLSPSTGADKALRSALTASRVRGRLDVGTTWSGALSQNGEVAVTEGPTGVRAWRGLRSATPAARVPGGAPVIADEGRVFAAVTRDGVVISRSDGGGGRVRIARAISPAFSTDGTYAAAYDLAGAWRVVDARTGRSLAQRRALVHSQPVLSFDPAHPERLIAGECDGGALTVWNWRAGGVRTLRARSRPEFRSPRGGDPSCLLAVSPDGALAAQSVSGGSVVMWDLRRGRQMDTDLASGLAVRDIAWRPDGRQLAIAAGKVTTVADRSGHPVWTTPTEVDFVSSVAFARPDGELLVTTSRDGSARVWTVDTGQMFAELRGHTDEVVDAAFIAAGRDVVTLSLDGTVRSWQVADGRVFRGPDWVLDAAFSPDGKRIAIAAADGTARVVPLDGGRTVPISATAGLESANSIAFDRSGRRVAVAGVHDANLGAIVVADANTGDVQQEMYPQGEAKSAAFSPDGASLVTTAGGKLALWPLSQRGVLNNSVMLPLPQDIIAVRAEFSPDGHKIVAAGNDGIARLYDVRSHRQTRNELRTLPVMYGATFSPDGRRILTYGSEAIARIWDARTGRLLVKLTGPTSWISRGAFSPNGRRVAASSIDQTTRVWDARSGQLLSTQREHGDSVNSVAFSPDGRTLLSGGDDGTARLYPCTTCGRVQDLIRLAGARIVSR